MENKAKDKLSVKKMISNVIYILRFAAREDAAMVFGYITGTVIYKVTDAIFGTLLIKNIINMLVTDAPLSDILTLGIAALFIIPLTIVIEVFLDYYFIDIRSIASSGNIAREFFLKSARMDLICYDDPDYYNDFVTASQWSEDMMRQAVSCVGIILGQGLAILSITGIVLTINPVIAVFPVAGFLINILSRFEITRQEYAFDMEKKRINRRSDYSKRVFYQPEYAKEIKLTDIEIPLREQFHAAIAEEKAAAKRYGRRIAALSLVNWIFAFTTLQYFAVPVYIGYLALVKARITLGDAAALKNATDSIQWWLDQTNYALIDFQKVGQYAEKFRRFVEYKEKIETAEGTAKVPDEDGTLEIKNMSFSYRGDDKYVLKNVNMTVGPREKIAIVGENGAGKTTLVKLIMRLYDATQGRILYGGRDIREYKTADYRRVIGAVFQDYQIYAASLGENVKMDVCDFEKDGDELKNALALADFSGKYEKLSKGLQTELTREFSDDGTVLSGGESQKAAISRLFAKPGRLSVAILDEPSSALDPRAEHALNKAMADSAADSAVVFISHRLSTTRDADRIYMFENGEIIEQGTHAELMESGGGYARMFDKQSRYYKECP